MIRNRRNIYMMLMAAVISAVSCEPSHLEDNLPPSAVYFVDGGQHVVRMFDVQKTVKHTMNVYCGGYYEQSPEVGLVVDRLALIDFNTERGTAYRMLPEECYDFKSTSAIMNEGKASFELVFDVEELKKLSQKEDYSDLCENYILPVSVISHTEGIGVSDNREVTVQFLTVQMTNVYYDILDCSSYSYDHRPELMCDGNRNTYWQNAVKNSHYGDMTPPYSITLELPALAYVSGLKISRYPSVLSTQTESGYVEVSSDLDAWTKVADIAFGTTSANNKRTVKLEFAPVEARYVRIVYTDSSRSYNGVTMVAISELEILIR